MKMVYTLGVPLPKQAAATKSEAPRVVRSGARANGKILNYRRIYSFTSGAVRRGVRRKNPRQPVGLSPSFEPVAGVTLWLVQVSLPLIPSD
jgi:hypothetical protein